MDPSPAQPGLDHAVIELFLADGSRMRYIVHQPLDASVASDIGHRQFDLEIGLRPPEVPRVFPVQIVFAFALPLPGGAAPSVEQIRMDS